MNLTVSFHHLHYRFSIAFSSDLVCGLIRPLYKVPKVKESRQAFLARIIRIYPNVFRADNSILYCIFCNCSVNSNRINNVKQHIESAKHKSFELRKSNKNQTLLTNIQGPRNSINQFQVNQYCAINMLIFYTMN